MELKNLSIVVCTKNSGAVLEACLQNVKKEVPESEVVVVDADSTDNTLEIAKKYANKVVSDQKKGLSYARQLGIDSASNDYVALVGTDNIIPQQTYIDLMLELQNDEKLAGAQPLTEILYPKNYWEWATKHIFTLLLNSTGFTDVVGTPCVFKKHILTSIRYDMDMKAGTDDTAVSLKLINAGYTLKRIGSLASEKQDLSMKTFFWRWKFYGKGDSQFYEKYSPQWTLRRKCRSLTHPLVKYALRGSWKAIKNGNVALLPALIFATFARYYGWVTEALRS